MIFIKIASTRQATIQDNAASCHEDQDKLNPFAANKLPDYHVGNETTKAEGTEGTTGHIDEGDRHRMLAYILVPVGFSILVMAAMAGVALCAGAFCKVCLSVTPSLQRSTLICANIVKKDPGRARQNSLVTAGTNFTKPGAQNKGDRCSII